MVGRLKSSQKESERNRRCFVSNGAPAVLASAFTVLADEPLEVSAEILEALVGLLPFDDEAAISELGSTLESIDSIVKIIRNGDVGSKHSAVAMVKKMAATAKAVSCKNGLAEALSELVREPVSPQVTRAALAAAHCLITDDEATAAGFVEMGLIPVVLDVLIGSYKSTVEKALAILDGMCGCDIGREEACGHGLTVPLLSKKMFRVSETATELAVSALWKLCRKCGGKCLVECLEVGMFQKLLLLLQVGCSESTKEKATEMLRLMSGCGEKMECVDTVIFKGLNRPSQ